MTDDASTVLSVEQIERLKKLGELRGSGVLTQEEFDELKAEILSKGAGSGSGQNGATVHPAKPDISGSATVSSKPSNVKSKGTLTGSTGTPGSTLLQAKIWLSDVKNRKRALKVLLPSLFVLIGIGIAANLTDSSTSKSGNSGDLMPNVRCMDLQTAQNTIQARTSRWYVASTDASGKGRRQVVDSNWVVIGQSPSAGIQIRDNETPTLRVVKFGENLDNC